MVECEIVSVILLHCPACAFPPSPVHLAPRSVPSSPIPASEPDLTGISAQGSVPAMKEKRGLEAGGGDGRPEAKRARPPALASVIVEALKMDSLQRLCSSLEPILRRVVSEEVERALGRFGPATISGRSSLKRIEGPDGRNLQLQFRTRLSLPLFTGGKVEGEQGAAIHVVLLDAVTGCVVSSGPESSAKLDIVVLEGDFNNEDEEGWTGEEFESHIVKEREGKRPILTGDLQVTLKEGVGTIGELTFTDNSSWIRSRKFRLGLKIVSGFCEGARIREAKTEAFMVKDHRGELYKKHYPPTLKDEVWRLEKIGKDGSFHKRLNKSGISTVEDFLRLVVRDPQKLRSILGGGMSNRMWETLVEHAKTCVLSGKYYIYYSDDSRTVGGIFNNIYAFCGLVSGEQFYSSESLDDSQKIFADALVKKAYDNWIYVIEYDGKALLNPKPKKKAASTGQAEMHPTPVSCSASYQQNVSLSMPGPSPAGRTDSIGYDVDQSATHPPELQSTSTSVLPPYDDTFSFLPPNMLTEPLHQVISQSQSIQPANVGYADWPSSSHRDIQYSDGFTEEDIRIKSHQMLESEDMQQLLSRVFSVGGASSSLPEDAYNFQSCMPSPLPSFGFEGERSHSSGKAVVGWLKIKAAMRWGIFIRKKAAERRAQLVELED
ncbi:calmodulin-binding protein 60 C-like isoform X2 [Phragmites australis]|uniref:calmodulin-binding protein 60 C-like isoform X2 n=1 Tax=Phragmites australis TaxID=29695 RepID=UPI002D79D637|nr:calmodulin-binding protein 60 C-like isoform X2 [Phragmites australis]